MTLAAWIAFAISLALLTITFWRRDANPWSRATLVIIGAASLSYALTDAILAPLLVALDLALVIVTWKLANSRYVQTQWGLVWILALIMALGAAKLPALQPY